MGKDKGRTTDDIFASGKMREMLERSDRNGKTGHANSANAEATVKFEGQDTPGMRILNEVAGGLMSRHFRNARDGTPDKMEFSGGMAYANGTLKDGFRVSAEPSSMVEGKGQGYTGWISQIVEGKVVHEGPFSANVAKPSAIPDFTKGM